MPDAPSDWTLQGFLERLDTWIAESQPPDPVRRTVTAWIFSRMIDPYKGVSREPGFENLWFGTVPNSQHRDGQVVVCAYWILEQERTVRCDSFATLPLPV